MFEKENINLFVLVGIGFVTTVIMLSYSNKRIYEKCENGFQNRISRLLKTFYQSLIYAAGSITECMAGRPTFRYRKIVIDPAVNNHRSIPRVINATSMKKRI